MKHVPSLCKLIFILAVTAVITAPLFAQSGPRQEKLLNGLKVLMWNDPGAGKVSLKLRIHSGSAFDPQGKEGVMRLLAEDIFPNAETREFFRDDLGGGLDITTTYDYIEIGASSKPSEFLNMLETVANAVSNISIDKEITAKLKNEQLERIKQLEGDPAYIADMTAAKQLLGTFPYGRPKDGTADSVKNIDFADLIDARDRFLTADNATVAISGAFDSNIAYRAIRRYFGSWLKADKRVPSTFRQPDPPSLTMKVVDSPVPFTSEFRIVRRGLARNDADHYAALILEKILMKRFRAGNPDAFVRYEYHVLPGIFTIGSSTKLQPLGSGEGNVGRPNTDDDWDSHLQGAVTKEEFDAARREVMSDAARQDTAALWLDVDTFKLASAKADTDRISAVTSADVQRVFDRLVKEPAAYVSVFARGKAPADTSEKH
jgi:zinc protease